MTALHGAALRAMTIQRTAEWVTRTDTHTFAPLIELEVGYRAAHNVLCRATADSDVRRNDAWSAA